MILARNELSQKDISYLTNASWQTVNNILITLTKENSIDFDAQNNAIPISITIPEIK